MHTQVKNTNKEEETIYKVLKITSTERVNSLLTTTKINNIHIMLGIAPPGQDYGDTLQVAKRVTGWLRANYFQFKSF